MTAGTWQPDRSPLMDPAGAEASGPVGHRLQVPDLIGRPLVDAVALAAELGISVNVLPVTSQRGPAGIVTAQSPPPGSRLEPQWRIHLLVAQLHPGVTAP